MTAEQYRKLVNQWSGYPDDRNLLMQIWTPEEIEEGRREALRENGGYLLNWQVELEIETEAQMTKYKRDHPTAKYPPDRMGTLAEVFVHWFADKLCMKYLTLFNRPDYSNREGRDHHAPNILTGRADGGETKGIRNFITRNEKGGEESPHGSLTFELFEGTKPGWLLSLYDLRNFNKIKKAKAVFPDKYYFVLMRAGDKPFATIVFEDVPKLRERLYNLCPDPDGWGLNGIENQKGQYNSYWEKYKQWSDEHGAVVLNNWQVPLKKLADLATVTMIAPEIDLAEERAQTQHPPCPPDEVTTARLNYLKRLAEEQGREQFDPATCKLATNDHATPVHFPKEEVVTAKWNAEKKKHEVISGKLEYRDSVLLLNELHERKSQE